MGTFREEGGASGLEGLNANVEWNTMHGFWLRFSVALVSTFVWVIMGTKMSMYGLSANML